MYSGIREVDAGADGDEGFELAGVGDDLPAAVGLVLGDAVGNAGGGEDALAARAGGEALGVGELALDGADGVFFADLPMVTSSGVRATGNARVRAFDPSARLRLT